MALKKVAMKAKPMKKTAMKKTAMKAKPMKAKRVSIIAKGARARAAVFNGRKERTVSGLTKSTLMRSKTGKIVSRKASLRAKKAFATSPLKKWCDAVKQARKALGIKGFAPCGGSTAQGKALYAKVKSILAD